MARVILLGAVVVAVAAGAIWWIRSQGAQSGRPPRPYADQDGQVVLMAFGEEWAKRFGSTEGELRGALLAGTDTALAERVDREVGIVDLRFDGGGGSGQVATTIIVTYASTQERSTAHLPLPWDDVPQAVRASLLRDGGTAVFRKWRTVS
jgi:hypothetical protein